MSPPTVRFNMEAVAITPNILGTSPGAYKRSPPLSSRSMQHPGSGTGFGHQHTSKLALDSSPMKTRKKLSDLDGKK